MIRKIVFDVPIAILSLPALATYWKYINLLPNNAVIYLDIDSIKIKNEKAIAWIKTEYKSLVTIDPPNFYDSLTVKNEYDCIEDRNRMLNYSAYLGRSVVITNSEPSDWSATIPDTTADRISKIACKKGVNVITTELCSHFVFFFCLFQSASKEHYSSST